MFFEDEEQEEILKSISLQSLIETCETEFKSCEKHIEFFTKKKEQLNEILNKLR